MTEGDVTAILDAVNAGQPGAHDRLIRVIYRELHQMAASRMRGERDDHTLQPTALVNEVYLRLVRDTRQWQGRGHFFAAAAEAMRRILIEHARQRNADKRGGKRERVTLADVAAGAGAPMGDLDLCELDEALAALQEEDPRVATVVNLRFFAGLSVQETGKLLELSPATVKRDWTYAKAWLRDRLTAGEQG